MKIKHTDAKMESGGITRNFWIVDDIAPDGEVFNWDTYRWETVESQTSQQYFVNNLQGLTSADSVNLYINSMGGSVKEALGIHSALQRCPAAVTAYIDGFAASAASVVAMAAKKVIMPRNTAMMIHNAAWYAYGNPAELRKSADDLEVINMAAIQAYTMHAGDKLPPAELRKMLDAETWLTAEDCVKFGLADEFANEDADVEKTAKAFNAAAQAAAGRPEAGMFRMVPAFLSGCGAGPAVKAQTREKQEAAPENHSCIYMLLKSMTN